MLDEIRAKRDGIDEPNVRNGCVAADLDNSECVM